MMLHVSLPWLCVLDLAMPNQLQRPRRAREQRGHDLALVGRPRQRNRDVARHRHKVRDIAGTLSTIREHLSGHATTTFLCVRHPKHMCQRTAFILKTKTQGDAEKENTWNQPALSACNNATALATVEERQPPLSGEKQPSWGQQHFRCRCVSLPPHSVRLEGDGREE